MQQQILIIGWEIENCKQLALLDAAELELILALYYEGRTERAWSDITGIPRMTICNRKYKILAKIKKSMRF